LKSGQDAQYSGLELFLNFFRPFEASMVNGNTGSFTWVGNPQSILFNGKGCYEDCTVGTNSTTCSVTAADGQFLCWPFEF